MRAPRLERLRTIAELARTVERPKRSLFRQLLALHAKTRAEGRQEWLFRLNTPLERGRWRVNLSVLRREHPALFETRYVRRHEHEELVARVAALEVASAESSVRLRTVAAKVRRVAGG